MKILSIETSGDICGAALVCGDKTISEKNIFLPKNSSSKIFDIVENVTKKNLFDAVAVDIGPGSFTGVRIGVSLARIFGQFLQVPVVGISRLDCMVFNAVKKKNIQGKIFPIVNALREEVYTAEYDNLKRKSDYKIIKIEKLLKMLDNGATIVGNDELCKKIPAKKIVVVNEFASSVGFLALDELKKHKKQHYENVLPLYIRRVFANEQRKKQN